MYKRILLRNPVKLSTKNMFISSLITVCGTSDTYFSLNPGWWIRGWNS